MGAAEKSRKRIAQSGRKRFMGMWAFSGDSLIHSVSEQLVAGTQRRIALSAAMEAFQTLGDGSGPQDQ